MGCTAPLAAGRRRTFGGVHGLTFVILMANECAGSVIRAAAGGPGPLSARDPAGACFAALALGLAAYGAVRCRQMAIAEHAGTPVTAGVVQADISQYGQLAADLGTSGPSGRSSTAHFALSTEVLRRAPLDLLVWPETSIRPRSARRGARTERPSIARSVRFVAAAGIPLVFGSYDVDVRLEHRRHRSVSGKSQPSVRLEVIRPSVRRLEKHGA